MNSPVYKDDILVFVNSTYYKLEDVILFSIRNNKLHKGKLFLDGETLSISWKDKSSNRITDFFDGNIELIMRKIT
jgi:hypothetical protein